MESKAFDTIVEYLGANRCLLNVPRYVRATGHYLATSNEKKY